jgi:uncharacterized protein YoxC
MSPTAVWVLVIAAVVFVGFAIPVLIQLRQTLKVAEDTLTVTGRRVDEALIKLSLTLDNVNRATTELEHGVRRISGLLEALGTAGDAITKVRASVGSVASMAMSIGGLLAGVVRSAFSRRKDHDGELDDESGEPIERMEDREVMS